MATLRKLLASLVVVGSTAGLMAFGTLGAFDDAGDHFPHSVIVSS